jgi:hypothetical protein
MDQQNDFIVTHEHSLWIPGSRYCNYMLRRQPSGGSRPDAST